MYVLFEHGFVDIVEDRESPHGDVLMVRARRREDLERFMQLATPTYNNVDYPPEIQAWDIADYRFRVFLYRKEVEELIVAAITKIDYTSFKTRMLEVDPELHEAMLDWWLAFVKLQIKEDV
jgi:hypothetical protein